MSAKNDDSYALATGQVGAVRLDLQNKIFGQESFKHLERGGLSSGKTVWDIGCGVGSMTIHLAKTVGDAGRVYAIDISEEQLKIARERVRAEGLNNVTFILGDICKVNDLHLGLADIIYMRYVLMHLKDPENIISKVKGFLKEGGVVVSQESITSTAYAPSHSPVFRELGETKIAMGKKLGVDYDIGNRLHTLYKESGYVNIEIFYSQQELSLSEAKQLILLSLSEWKDRAIEVGVVTQEKVKTWDLEIRNWSECEGNNFFMGSKQSHVLAWK